MSMQSDEELEKLCADESESDIDRVAKWQKTKDPELLADLVLHYQPIVNKVVAKYKTTGVSTPTLKAHAQAQLLKALQTYDPSKKASPTTHIWNNLMQVQRVATESLISGHIPEYRNLKRSIFLTTKKNLEDRLGYEPTVAQMADEMGWSEAEVQRMNEEIAGEVTASSAEFDFYGNARQFAHKDKELVDYLYHSITDPKDRLILEYTIGYGGKPVLTNKEIAQKLRTNEMAIHRAKMRMSNFIKQFE